MNLFCLNARTDFFKQFVSIVFKVLNAKVRRAHELKRKLGVTVWGEFTQDMNMGIKTVRDSTA